MEIEEMTQSYCLPPPFTKISLRFYRVNSLRVKEIRDNENPFVAMS